jgi:hypothetical protein
VNDLPGVPHPLRISKGAGFDSIDRRKDENPDPFEPERVGHPKRLNQSLSVDLLEWYNPALPVRQKREGEWCATRQLQYVNRDDWAPNGI